MKEQEKYAIDACALIDASKAYPLDKKTFTHVWDKFSELFLSGRLVSSVEVYDELRDKDLKSWIKPYKFCFLPLCEEVQSIATEILATYPELVKIRSRQSSSNADPFIIATALKNNCTVVTNERLGDESTRDIRIPNVCRKYNLRYIGLRGLVDEIFD